MEEELEGVGKKEKKKGGTGKAVIVGGSIGGMCCANALITAGWDLLVIEKSTGPPTGSPTGAGLGLDPLSQNLIGSWTGDPELLLHASLPQNMDLNQTMHREKNIRSVLARDEDFKFRAAHWADLHGLLYRALPSNIFLWGHLFISFTVSNDKSSVTVKAKVMETGEIVEISGDLLIAADGSLSSVRGIFLPDLKLRYAGYCAWRGVLDYSGKESFETIVGIRKAYPELGKYLYFDLGYHTHTVLFELPNKKINWIWYVNQPEPELKGNSVTMKVDRDMIETMYKEAENVWIPEMVSLMKETKDPFVNVIYDCNPLEQIVWDNVVLVGDAAHPVTPNGVRSTNMSILDAAVLGKCLAKWGPQKLDSALKEYESIRLPVISKQVLHTRRIGRIKQGLALHDREPFDPGTATQEECRELQQKHMPFFADVPSILGID